MKTANAKTAASNPIPKSPNSFHLTMFIAPLPSIDCVCCARLLSYRRGAPVVPIDTITLTSAGDLYTYLFAHQALKVPGTFRTGQEQHTGRQAGGNTRSNLRRSTPTTPPASTSPGSQSATRVC